MDRSMPVTGCAMSFIAHTWRAGPSERIDSGSTYQTAFASSSPSAVQAPQVGAVGGVAAPSSSAAVIVPSPLCRSIFLGDSRETEDRENRCRRHATAIGKVGCAHATLAVRGERMRCGDRGPGTAAQPDAENRCSCSRVPAKVGRYEAEAIEHALALLDPDELPTAARVGGLCASAPAPAFRAAPELKQRQRAAEVRRKCLRPVAPKAGREVAWATELVQRAQDGEPVSGYRVRVALDALGRQAPLR